MSKMNPTKPVAAVIAAALFGSLSVVSVTNAAENPFTANQSSSGHMVLASSEEGSEGKCGGEKKEGEAKCGGEKKEGEAKCGGEKKEGAAKSGGAMEKGEGKCGGE